MDVNIQMEKARRAWLDHMREYIDPLGLVRLPATAPMLAERHLENCRVLPNREAILRRTQAGGTAAEVGVQTGRFSKSILDICRPSRLHLIDIDLSRFNIKEKFKPEIDKGVVQLHEHDSSTVLREFPDRYFDFVYIDADHSYEGVKRDIQAAKSKVKENGLLIFNDYTYWSPLECMSYGVIHAVNELCIEEDWEMIYFALENHMYCDAAVRRR